MNWPKTAWLLLLAFLGVFAEAAVEWPRPWWGVQVNVLPPLMVYAAASTDLASLALLALLGGLWSDALSANALGASVAPLLVLGLVTERWRDLVLRELPYAQFILGSAASALAPLLTLLILLSVGQHPLLGWGSLGQWVATSLIGGALTPICFRLLGRLEAWFTYQPMRESPFRPDRQLKRGRS